MDMKKARCRTPAGVLILLSSRDINEKSLNVSSGFSLK